MHNRSLSLFSSFLILIFLAFTGCDSTTGPDDGNGNGSQNQAPTADAGSGQTVDVDEETTLDGSASSDADGDNLTYSWSLDSPDGSTATLNSPDQSNPTFTPDVSGDYTATLTVTDPDGEEDSDQVTVTAQGASTVVISQDITADRTLTDRSAGDTPDYRVTSEVGISDAALTIEPGVRIVFEANAGLAVRTNTASLQAKGTASDPIVMTGVQEDPGFWKGVAFYSDNALNEMTHVEVAYGGSDAFSHHMDEGGNISLNNGARVKLTNSTIRNSGTYGLSGDEGVDLSGFSGNTFEDNAEAPVRIPATAAGYIDGASSFANNTEAYVRVDGKSLSNDVTLTKLSDAPYRFLGETEIRDASWTIQPGVVIEFGSKAGLAIRNDAASLQAKGTASDPIVMTGVQEDPGFWKGVAFYSDNALNEMAHVEVAYGGSDAFSHHIDEGGNISLDNGAVLSLSNSTIRNSNTWGVWLDQDAALNEDSNTYQNNASGSIGQ